MKNEVEQLKALKELLDSGSISQREFEEMKSLIKKEGWKEERKNITHSQEGSNQKTFLIVSGVVILIAAIGYFMFFNDAEFEKHAQELALADCKCKEENNQSYITNLESMKTELENTEEVFIAENYVKRLEEYRINHENIVGNSTLRPCLDEFEQLKTKFTVEYPQTSRDGKDFWVLYQNQVQNNESLAEQKNRVNALIGEINTSISSIPFKTELEFNNTKNNTISFMEDFFGSYGNESFDAHEWFTGTVDFYIKKQNVSPTKINELYYAPNLDHVSVYNRLLPQTVKFKGMKDGFQTWEFTTDFECYRPSREQTQYSKVVYEVKIENNRLRSFREVKAYNTTYEGYNY
jgi:hypothetical protein